jgi:hypothetical protein
MTILPQSLSRADQTSLVRACQRLEYPSFAARLSSVVGTPIEMGMQLLPRHWYFRVQRCAENAISRALDAAIANVMHKTGQRSDDRRYKLLGMASGAVGGFFGGPALLLELPLTTTLMLSSIADIARSQGEDMRSWETRMACMEVFALGGRSHSDDAAETGYYGIRMALEIPIATASSFLARQGTTLSGNAPVLVNLIRSLAERFGVVLSQKAAVEIIPILGAFGGAFINHVFIQHFQDMAHSHFTIRRLERKYDPALIQAAYERVRQSRAVIHAKRLAPPSRRLPKIVKAAA